MISNYISIIINDIQTWCATEVDKDGIFQGDRLTSNEQWGYCGPDCPTHEETMTWRKDKTIKMTLHYHDHTTDALWAGLEWYLWSLLPISFLGLLFTTAMPILGKVMVQSVFPIIVPIIQF